MHFLFKTLKFIKSLVQAIQLINSLITDPNSLIKDPKFIQAPTCISAKYLGENVAPCPKYLGEFFPPKFMISPYIWGKNKHWR